jgi:hypothetical protein
MVQGETELQMVERHIREGEDIVTRHETLIQVLQDDGPDSRKAELLAMFRKTVANHYEHLARLTKGDVCKFDHKIGREMW